MSAKHAIEVSMVQIYSLSIPTQNGDDAMPAPLYTHLAIAYTWKLSNTNPCCNNLHEHEVGN